MLSLERNHWKKKNKNSKLPSLAEYIHIVLYDIYRIIAIEDIIQSDQTNF